jgi:hypothetical protein
MPLADQELNISAAGVLAALATLGTVLAFFMLHRLPYHPISPRYRVSREYLVI